MNEALQVELAAAGDSVVITGAPEDIHAQMFFGTVLGAVRDGSTWQVPLRDEPADQIIALIDQWASDFDLVAEAQEQRAQRVLQLIRESRIAYSRTRRAATRYLGLDGTDPAPEFDESALASRLAKLGWQEEARPLLAHQLRAALHALHAQHAANFSVPGAGKTTTTLAVVGAHLAVGTIDAVVVVGPLSCFRPWESEIAAALPTALNVRRIHNMSPAQRRETYHGVAEGDVLLISYATAAGDEEALRSLGERLNILLVADESHRVKRFTGGMWAEALVRIAERARIRLILTGTPMPHSPRDLWSQFTILWPGGELAESRSAHTARINRGVNTVIEHFAPYYFRTPKAQLGLRPYKVEVEPVEASKVQAEIYEAIAQGLRSETLSGASGRARLQMLRRGRPIRLLQAASNPALLAEDDGFFGLKAVPSGTLLERLDNYRSLGELPAKMEWVLERLQGLQRENEKVVIWTSFIRNIDQLRHLVLGLFDTDVYSVDGRIPAAGGEGEDELDDTREERIDAFLRADGFAVLIANPAACAESISLHSQCHRALYLDRTYDCARWLQSIDRIHRLGLPKNVQVEVQVPQLQIQGQPTIDDLVQASLQRKEATMKSFLQGAELRDGILNDQDTLSAAEGDERDLEELLRYLIGEAPDDREANGS
ncbi:MAG TPA: DEAD/DEAH box helicase [Solirubrobacterales bacterium]|nr:DEAD/DEAH box helicase [Solirubrobacterales bacterium]